jgi:methylenetetrahydrofolate reductase (NADPH)
LPVAQERYCAEAILVNAVEVNTVSAPPSAERLKSRILELMRQASTEITVDDDALVPALAARLPAGSCVHVAHTPKASLDQVVHLSVAVQRAGLAACPHIVARRIVSLSALRSALRELKRGGVAQILLVAGDLEKPVGAFASTLQILDSGVTLDNDITVIGVAGHPEGHRAISSDALWQALAHKQAFGERNGTAIHIVTQFSFNPDAIFAWERQLCAHGIRLPVRVGIAGPTPLLKLLQFAVRCGVGTSLRTAAHALSSLGSVSQLATTPDQHLIALARAHDAGRSHQLVAPHFFAFGGSMKTTEWRHQLLQGDFQIAADNGSLRPAG